MKTCKYKNNLIREAQIEAGMIIQSVDRHQQKVVMTITRSTSNGEATTSGIYLQTISVELSIENGMGGERYVDSLFYDLYPSFRRLDMNALESFEILETAYPMTQFDTPEHLIRICQFLS
jgi:hypothetical protein